MSTPYPTYSVEREALCRRVEALTDRCEQEINTLRAALRFCISEPGCVALAHDEGLMRRRLEAINKNVRLVLDEEGPFDDGWRPRKVAP